LKSQWSILGSTISKMLCALCASVVTTTIYNHPA
jgi:hypothetical protein